VSHFDEMTCMLYLDAQLDEQQGRELEVHTGTCGECHALLTAMKRESLWLEHSFQEADEELPAGLGLTASAGRGRAKWAWLAAAGLGVAGLYTLWNTFITPFEQQASQAGLNESNLMTILVFRGAFWKGWGFMTNMIEAAALAMLGVVIYGLVHRNWRRWTTLAIVFCSMLLMLGGARATAAAQLVKGNPDYDLGQEQTVNDDLFLTADFAHIDGTVNGDVFAFVQDMTITGHVTGDVIVVGRNLRISGVVDGNVRSYGQFLVITGSVGKNMMAAGEEFELDPNAKIGGTATIGGKDAVIGGDVGRTIMVGTDRTTINGSVGGGAMLSGNVLIIGSRARIGGPVHFRGKEEPRVEEGAQLASPVTFEKHTRTPDYQKPRYYVHQALSWGAAFVFGLLLVLVMPGFFSTVEEEIRNWRSLLGLLILVCVPLTAILLCITLVGIPIGIAVLLLWLICLYATQVFVGAAIGRILLGHGEGFGPVLGRMALGLLILRVVWMVPILGGWVHFLVVIWGLGAVTLASWKRLRQRPALI
jgi:anti-sigma factor RsiW